MKITLEILSIPPYISTSWENISSLSLSQKGELKIQLAGSQDPIAVPDLPQDILIEIFDTHAKVLEAKKPLTNSKEDFQFPLGTIGLRFPLKNDGGLAEPLMTPMQHNPSHANLPPLPPAILKKIASMAEAFGINTLNTLPQGEPGCHCIFCQVMNAFHIENEQYDEEISAEDLKFKDWEVTQVADQLYNVTNPLDQKEQYRVFLGNPIGCTCGEKTCEHIRSVLKT
ncbi:MAG TPA: hypothetical protein VJK48_06215 [Chlamydiales bacterium]|nr:MAG: hypothetical protein A3F67_10485 [Verrucomicrobia bacterium RIFCSPHIGHO2_12_FULL_41_10]HLB53280.1 hypothetical protein [Chlamydiales bacterium]